MISDEFGLPRDPETAIHALVGEWEYRRASLDEELPEGWTIVQVDGEHALIQCIHASRCGCGLEWEHDPEIMWVL